MRDISKSTIVVGVLLILAIAGFGFYYFSTLSTISSLQAKATADATQISTLQGQLTAANEQVTSLQQQVDSSKSQLMTLQGQLNTAKAQVQTLEGQLTSANTQISGLQSQLTTSESEITSLQDQLATKTTLVTDLQNQVTTLGSQKAFFEDVANLDKATTVVEDKAISQPFGSSSQVTSFTATYAGYLVVQGTSSSATGYITVTDSFTGYPLNSYHYTFGLGNSLTIPVLPGTITVSFGNNAASGTVNATITVSHVY